MYLRPRMIDNDQYTAGVEGITNEAMELEEPDDINPYSTTTSNGLPLSKVQEESVDINPYAMTSDTHTISNGAAQSGDHIDDINPYSVTTETKQMATLEEPDDINPYATSAGPGLFSNQKGQRKTAIYKYPKYLLFLLMEFLYCPVGRQVSD